MLNSRSVKKSNLGILVLIVAFSLMLSFVFHEFIPHEHHHGVASVSDAQLSIHNNDKKLLYIILIALLSVAITFIKKSSFYNAVQTASLNFSYFKINLSKLFNPVLQALRTGILNPKLCN